MKYFFLFFSLSLTLLSAKIEILNLEHNGSVRYISKGNQLHKIQRISSLNELMYTHEYLYDRNGQLFGERLCDAFGNIVHSNKFKVIKKNYFSPSNENEPFTKYDRKGNLTALDEKKFKYDNNNRLVKVTTPHCTIEYDYDSSGKRLSRTINGTIQYFVYLGTNELAILDDKSDIIELRIPGLSFHKDICRPIAIETPEAFFAPVLNAQGSCIKLINIITKEETDLDIDSYGKGLNKTIPTPWVFSGKHYDKEAGLVYFGNRYYCPEIKSWLTPDPLKQTNNPYLFCLGNPSKYIDPDGLWAIAIPIVQFAIGAGATLTSPIWLPISPGAAAGAAIGYLGHKGYKYWDKKKSTRYNINKSGSIDPSLPVNPDELLKRPGWKETTHPKAGKKGHRTFENEKTGEKLRHDKGKPKEQGHDKYDHYHKLNPKTTSKHNRYLDHNNNPVGKNSEKSHLYPPENVWWQ